MILEPTTDQAMIKAILSHDDIWELAAEDEVIKEEYWPTVNDSNVWLICSDGDTVFGIILAHLETSCSIMIHPYLRKQYRRKGREMMKKLFQRFLDHTPESFVKISAIIPDCYKSAQNFAKRVGFKEEGVSRNSYRKKGEVFDRRYYGITREEIEVLL